MPSRNDSEVIVRRLKALKVIPEAVPARIDGGCRGAAKAGNVLWAAVDGAGRPLGIASRFPQRQLLAHRRWRFRMAGGVVMVEPDGGADG